MAVLSTYRQCMNLVKCAMGPLPEDSLGKRAITKLDSFVEKADRYKWHDIRKNPDDLPEEDGIYLVRVYKKGNPAWSIPEHYSYMIADYNKNDGFWTIGRLMHLLGWKEIEPIEGE